MRPYRLTSGVGGGFLIGLFLCVPWLTAVALADAPPATGNSASSQTDHGQALVAQAHGLIFPSQPPLRHDETSAVPERSGTTVLNEIKSIRDELDPGEIERLTQFLGRPEEFDESYATAHFRLHYRTTQPDAPLGWPDPAFLDVAAAACEKAWNTYHLVQGWPRSPRDGREGGDPRIDVYILDLGWGIYGYALHEELKKQRGKTGFIVVDNDYAGFNATEPLNALRTTIAHEYHHLVQFGFGYDPEAGWFMEQMATMEEAQVFPEIRDLDAYLPVHAEHPHRRLDLCNGSFEYGTWLWPRFLEEHWGWELLISVWETWGAGQRSMKEVLGQELADAGSSLNEAFLEWTIWNAFRGAWDDGAHYDQGHRYGAGILPEVVINLYPVEGIHPDLTRQPEALGASYVEFRPQAGSADNHMRIFLRTGESLIGGTLIIWDSAQEVRGISSIDASNGVAVAEVPEWSSVERAWLILANGAKAEQACDYAVSATTRYTTADVGEDPAGTDILRLRCGPNPFEPYTVIFFQLPKPMDVVLRIFDTQGRLVETLLEGPCSEGSHAIFWGQLYGSGAGIPAGIFYGQMDTPLGNQRIRMIHVR